MTNKAKDEDRHLRLSDFHTYTEKQMHSHTKATWTRITCYRIMVPLQANRIRMPVNKLDIASSPNDPSN